MHRQDSEEEAQLEGITYRPWPSNFNLGDLQFGDQ